MSFPRYSEYKNSGVEWLGEVPAHWEVSRLKFFGELITGITPPSEDLSNYSEAGWPWVRPDDLDDQGAPVQATKFLTDQGWSYCRPVASMSTLVCCIGSIGKLGFTTEVACTNQQITAVQPFYDARFLFYLACASKPELDLRATGNVLRILNAERLGNVPAVMPPIDESAHIATFLDYETARIDALVEEQQRLIELLKEKRQAVISHAVTKGLDPDVPMKDSGVEWLGEVPAHWEVAPLKYLATEKVAGPYGASLTKAMYTTSGYRVYGQQQVIPNDFSSGDYHIPQEKFEEMIRYQVFPGDVLFSVMGTVGKVAVVPPEVEPGIINPRLVRYRFCRKVNPDFIRLLVMSQHFQRRLQESAQGSTMEGLNMSILGDLPILLPDPEEQGEIVTWLTKESSLLEELVSQAKHAIELLNERRSALISAAVTGKIDVRGWQSPAGSLAATEAMQTEAV